MTTKHPWLASCVLLVPLLLGFECTYHLNGDGDGDSDVDWTPGDPCDFENDFPTASVCVSESALYFCNDYSEVQAWPCDEACEGGICRHDDELGYGWCFCPEPLEPGHGCDRWTDFPGRSTCVGVDTLYFCNADDLVQVWTCSDSCEGGFCGHDGDREHDWCFCPECGWNPGCTCSYRADFASATCDEAGEVLTYCAEDNVVAEVDCTTLCEDAFGDGATGECGPHPDMGNTVCVCETAACDGFVPYCNDARWLVSCDADSGETAWEDCGVVCSGRGHDFGLCQSGECVCG